MKFRLLAGIFFSLCCSVALAQWQLLPGLATDIGLGPRGEAWVVGIDQVEGGHPIFRWTGGDWQIVPGGAMRIDVDPQGNPWVINADGYILRAGPSGWERLPGLARDIGIGADGSVWVVGITQTAGGFTLHRWNGRDWDLMPGGAVRIDVDRHGNPWVVNDRGEIFRWTSGRQWQRLPGSATAVTVSNDGTAWILGMDQVPGGFSIQRWTGRGWRRVEGGAIAISAAAVPWLVNSENRIFRWNTRR